MNELPVISIIFSYAITEEVIAMLSRIGVSACRILNIDRIYSQKFKKIIGTSDNV